MNIAKEFLSSGEVQAEVREHEIIADQNGSMTYSINAWKPRNGWRVKQMLRFNQG